MHDASSFLVQMDERGHAHFVGGEGSGFVGTDDRGTAECLHRRQLADNAVSLGHGSRTQR